jgi:hypothetical protein
LGDRRRKDSGVSNAVTERLLKSQNSLN